VTVFKRSNQKKELFFSAHMEFSFSRCVKALQIFQLAKNLLIVGKIPVSTVPSLEKAFGRMILQTNVFGAVYSRIEFSRD